MKNFTCPNCKTAATLKDIVLNKKLREIISWFKELTNDNSINIQNQNAAGSQVNSFNNLNTNYLNNIKGFNLMKQSQTPSNLNLTNQTKDQGKEQLNQMINSSYPNQSNIDAGKVVLNKEVLLSEKLNILKTQTAARAMLGVTTPTARENISFQQNFGSDEKKNNINNPSTNINNNKINPNNLFSNNDNIISHINNSNVNEGLNNNFNKTNLNKEIDRRRESLDEKMKNSDKIFGGSKLDYADHTKNDINKIEFKKENNMTPEEKMQLYHKINNDSSVSGSIRKHSEDINESASQKGTTSKIFKIYY